jgi:hypothetical protein
MTIASTAGIGFRPHASSEYAAAKAGLIRFSSSLACLRERINVRVNCVVPDWIATERALDQLARMTPAEHAAAPTPRPPEEIAAAVVDFIRDEGHSDRVMVMWPGEPPRVLDPEVHLYPRFSPGDFGGSNQPDACIRAITSARVATHATLDGTRRIVSTDAGPALAPPGRSGSAGALSLVVGALD